MATPDFHQTRHNLLCAMKHAPDYYELQIATAQYESYVDGLCDGGAIGFQAHILYREEGNQVNTVASLALSQQVA